MSNQIDELIKTAAGEIGTKEFPFGSNTVKYNTEYYGRAVSGSDYPWCCAFIWWVFRKCGLSTLFFDGDKTAYCPAVESHYRSYGRWYTKGKRGDLALFDFNGKGKAGHIGIVESVNADGTYTCIEGNTSVSSNDNGGCVMRRIRRPSQIRGFARPKYEIKNIVESTTVTNSKGALFVNVTLNVLQKGAKGKQVKTLQTLLIAAGYSCGTYGVDGDFGGSTNTAVRAYQKANKLVVDGVVGQNTWNSLLR